MSSDPIVPRIVRRHLGEPSEIEEAVEDAVTRQAELLDTLLRCAAEIDHLRHVSHAAIDSADDSPTKILGRVGDHLRARRLRASCEAELRLRDVAAQTRALITRIRRDNTLDMRDMVRALEGIVEAAGVKK